ncbi:unnamed protein product [Caenorhabditis sp. 36 PRJEB53466]|nr:unnamed protein product [Caenorhabditis sp. 36 PRJEB53466]
MKITKAIAEIVSEFSGLNRSPNFKKASTCSMSSPPTSGTTSPARKNSGPSVQQAPRRYSVVVAVGVSPLPQPTGTGDKAKLI